jgi:ketosteroid isomerase-like protein
MRRHLIRYPTVSLLVLAFGFPGNSAQGQTTGADQASVRKELEGLYALNTAAYLKKDLAAVMALRAPDFHSVAADSSRRDRAAMAQYIQGIMNGISEWKKIEFTIDSLRVTADTAYAIVTQHLDRRALRPDQKVHDVETWVTQREIWIRANGRWLMWRVDGLRNQKRLVDGKPE